MPSIYSYKNAEPRHSEDIQDIITAVPSWIVRWGTTLFFGVLVLIIGLSAFIRYPDIVNETLKINSPNSPKPVVAKQSGKLVKLLVNENAAVKAGDPLAYMESTADHDQVINLLNQLKAIQKKIQLNLPVNGLSFDNRGNSQFGELQTAYQTFYQEYLIYRSSVQNGFDLKKRNYLQKDIAGLNDQIQKLDQLKEVQKKDSALAGEEYRVHQKLLQQKVETRSDFRQQESN